MTDKELLFKKLALIETCVQELRTVARPEVRGRFSRKSAVACPALTDRLLLRGDEMARLALRWPSI